MTDEERDIAAEERDDILREEGLAEQEEFDRPRREYADAHVGRY